YEVQPDAIVSVHALCTQLALRCLREIRKDIAVFNVVTDIMDIHRSWVAAGVDLYFAGTEDAARAIEALGVPSHCIVVSGIPLRRQFWPGNGAAPHRMAGLASTLEDVFPRSSHRLRVLALDGGVPGPQLPQVVDTLSGAGISMDIVVGWGGAEPPRPAHKLLGANRASVRHLALGEPISPHMRKVDLVITKAGSVTIAESLALARPLLLHRVAPGQESSNPSLVERFGAGLHVPTLRHVVDTLRRLDACPEEIARMRANARLHGRPDAANDVAAHIMRSLNVAEQVCEGAAG
ncbi:MAG: galactosyldiacylglycerol synthase, partial [Chloroflexi bacterium]|nr:galactosyldiacylglycerol synthase [Chloroflexota bacterium]